jgi:ATP-dependent RNA helicase RhlE
MSFENLKLIPQLLQVITESGYTTPTPVQEQAIPVILEGRDVIAGAQTGTGKTAAFTLPLLQRLAAEHIPGRDRQIRVLVLTPTRELASQVEQSIKDYGKHLPLKSAVIFGGVKIEAQIHKLQRGFDILVATPGRLMDHMQRRTVNLSRVDVLVLDEADRMLDMGFIRDIRKIISILPVKRQNLLFSATYSKDIEELAASILRNPAKIAVATKNTTADGVEQIIHPVSRERKRELLSFLIGSKNWKQVLVFARTKHGANRLAEQLCLDGLDSAAFHGNKSQAARTKALNDFKDGKVRVLVATDIAARGIDIDNLPHVVNYDLPAVPADYVHRIGRTGRAGNEGTAISLVSVDDEKFLQDIERLLKKPFKKTIVPGYEPDPNQRAVKPAPRNFAGGGRSGGGAGRPGGGAGRSSSGRSSSGGSGYAGGGAARSSSGGSGYAGGGAGRSSGGGSGYAGGGAARSSSGGSGYAGGGAGRSSGGGSGYSQGGNYGAKRSSSGPAQANSSRGGAPGRGSQSAPRRNTSFKGDR